MKIYSQKEILERLDIPYIICEIEKGLIAYSKQNVHPANVAFLRCEENHGEVHVKPAGIKGEDLYVVKIASGFYNNPKLGLATCQGLMLLFSQKTGQLEAILLDEGILTDIRTALAGAICAKHLSAPVKRIGIIGTGTQAKMQLHYLSYVTDCREAIVWGRSEKKAIGFVNDPLLSTFDTVCAQTIEEVTDSCNLIITATSSSQSLLFGYQIKPGTHITAVGADDPSKQELDHSVFARADKIYVDSLSQCKQFGDLSHAVSYCEPIELGKYLEAPFAREAEWVTVADLTGLGVEDLQIAKSVLVTI